MLVYPVPHAVTQARVQLVADQTEKAPADVIREDVLNVYAAKNDAERQALADFKAAQAKEAETHSQQMQDQAQQNRAHDERVQREHVQQDHVDVKA
jgi:hypothetical protein